MSRDSRPPHLQWRLIALVALGGALGTAARAGLGVAVAAALPGAVFPVTTFTVNLVGAFVLGMLLEALVLRGPDEGARRGIRLFIGTGVLGGFTTYSAFSADTARLLLDGEALIAVGYALGTVVIGAVASLGGILLAQAAHRETRGAR
ncbi:CrcB family protein [Agromyces intestinalis]|uniref:Fluoride-specific ion channel FluC n=1 Tax=Agromyces intestinalis TaxID=2592652 RepID=A0A5C1YHS1_9MICO|nr:CrcB family protein [Agromyces intestinalis]QEO14639.1 CrcB family protein [Agromyces intestinalis]